MTGDELSLSRIVAANGDLLVDVTLKSLLVLLATALVAWGLRRRSAALLHGVWTAGFLICAAIPVIALAAPAWNLAILPASLQAGRRPVAETEAEHLADRAPRAHRGDAGLSAFSPGRARNERERIDRGDSRADRRDLAPAVKPDRATSAESVTVGTPAAAQSQSQMPSWTAAAVACWLVGAAVIFIRSVWRANQLRTFLHDCRPVTDGRLTEAFEDAARRLDFRGSARLLENAGAEGPLVAGIVAAKVVLPAGAAGWNAECRQMVLLHELSHAKRRDVLTQTIAGLICAIHWFNPIAWWGLAQMRKLRELACDDMVVAAGQRPADYADVLLEVARSYRHRRRALAVGMARGANVERRILAILDRARNRMALSRRVVRTLLACAVVGATVVGTVRLQSRAETASATTAVVDKSTSKEPATSKQGDAAPATEAKGTVASDSPPKPQLPKDPNGRSMEVVVTDAAGAPIEGANVKASIWEFDGEPDYPTWDYTTDSAGVAYVKRPSRLDILRLWPEKPGYVSQFINFSEGTHDEGKKIPDRYEFRLEPATRLSGVVLDEAGNPIVGVTVHAKIEVDEPAWGENPKPMISTWIREDGLTDEAGKWTILGVPEKSAKGKDFEFRLKFLHDEYISDANYGELQMEQGVTTVALRDGTAKVLMRRGIPIKGTITDGSGSPVTKGLVIWSDNTYFAEGVNECVIGEDGRFETIPFPPGKRWITVLAPGYCADRREITVGRGMSDCDFRLKPGKRLALKVVDQSGKPVPKAYVGIGPWRGVNAIYNEKHPNVPESHIPRQADEDGNYVWDWAPEDAVTYQISAKGYAFVEVSLAPVESGSPHTVELPKPLVSHGKVTDAATGEPIDRFSVTPVIVFRPNFFSTQFYHTVPGRNGEYEAPLKGGAGDEFCYRVRVEADGYRSEVSEESFSTRDGRVRRDFALEPAEARRGIVVNASGEPVAGAEVVEATHTIFPSVYNAKVDTGDRKIETDADGAFELPATDEPYLLLVMHDDGHAEISRVPDEAVGTITLRPWANVSGQLVQAGKPVGNQWIVLEPVENRPLGVPRIQGGNQIKTDAEGRFSFDRVPPVPSSIRANLGPWRDSPLTSSQSEPLDLQPGKGRTVILGGDGATIIGRVVSTGRETSKLDKNWSLNHLINRDRGIEFPAGATQPTFNPTEQVEVSWFLDPSCSTWLATRANYFVKLTPEGDLRINGVPAGTYDLVLQLYEQPAGCLVETIGRKVVTIEVTEADVTTGVKEIGAIEVPCRIGPRVGQSMAAFRFVDAAGREVYVDELKGRHVLMHAWASWCGPCLESMPELKATADRLAEKPITFVGLNLDQDADAGRRVAEREKMAWSQNYLGDDSDLAKQLAISSVPTYYLIGPDGKLVASSTEWSAMKSQLEAAFGE